MNMISDPREHLVVIGNGMAGMRTIEEMLKLDGGRRYRITVFGAEPHVNYNRIMLSSVLAGDKHVEEIVINSREWYDENGITLVDGRRGQADRPGNPHGHVCRRLVLSCITTRFSCATGSKAAGAPDSRPRPSRRLRLPRPSRMRRQRCWQPHCTHKRAVVIARRPAGPGKRPGALSSAACRWHWCISCLP